MARATAASAAASTITNRAIDLAVQPQAQPAVGPETRAGEGHEIHVGPVEHQLDSHQHAQAVPLGGHADHRRKRTRMAPTTR